jgi:hypothetical protein
MICPRAPLLLPCPCAPCRASVAYARRYLAAVAPLLRNNPAYPESR